ncbi:hypothetical protein [Buttiauxella izardii]|uniref:Uncharacterized protein n=1 Tax=Buttiauxella izardii TaxID=82991 RepID=A0A3A5JXE8_9ENTR|nr:hypothetical protein [Buttiauxella izardii]RJT27691.1 hypothetical protein D6029_01865 [Buttiauxella izardii]
MSEIYDLVRRSDGKVMDSFLSGGRWQLYTTNGIVSVRPLEEDEIIFTPAGMIQLLRRVGYRVISTTGE